MDVSDDLVTSTGSVEAGGVFLFADWSRQRNAGLVWLTQYTRADQNATRLKMTRRADGSLLLLWELWTASSYVATKGMTVSANGAIVNGETDLTNHVRLTRSDDLMRVGDAIYLVAGNRTDRVLELIVLETQTLTVARSGAGGGTVASSPSGIDCGGTCSASFGTGSTILLTATSNAGSVFAGWTGAGCTGTAPCTVTLNAAATVTATFNVAPAGTIALTVSKSGSGIGTVTSAPTGINCGTNCVSSFNSGASVTLTAAPAPGSMFSGWSGGGCAGTGACAVTLSSATAVTATFNPATNIPRLVNISTRGQVGTGDGILIGGFIVGSGTPKKVIIKGRGPSMAPLGVQGTLSDPAIRLFSGATAIDSNDDWPSASNAAEITASGQAPTNTKESAILTTVTPGVPYTVHVTGVGATTGIAIVEVFELDKPEVPLLNISTRGPVLSGDQVMIGGFIIQGDAAQQVLVIAKGPSLAAAPFSVPGSLADPILELYQAGVAAPIETNDNWVSSSNMAAIQASGNAPTHSLESAIIRTLAPGAYTAIVKGGDAFQGIGLVEVYRK